MSDDIALPPVPGLGAHRPPELYARRVKFVELYAKYGNGERAAREAGYSSKNAASQASRLLRMPRVQNALKAREIITSVHAQQTYRNLIDVANVALHVLKKAHDDKLPLRDLVQAQDAAGRALERLGRAEGLFVERIDFRGQLDVSISLQSLVARAKPYLEAMRVDVPALEAPPWKSIDEDGPSNGNGNGNGHK